MLRFSIDGLDLTLNCMAYAHTAALMQSVGLHPNAGLNLMLSSLQTHPSVQIKYMGFEQVQPTHPLLGVALPHSHADVMQSSNKQLLFIRNLCLFACYSTE